MKKLGKFVGYVLASLLVLFLLAVGYLKNEERINVYYQKLFWRLPTHIEQIKVGDSENDVIFKLGKPLNACKTIEEERYCEWNSYRGGTFIVVFKDSLVSYFFTKSERSSSLEIPFRNVETMESILGKPNIFSESKDFSMRRYTYLYDGQNESGVTFDFESNKLIGYVVGPIEWRRVHSLGRYEVDSVKICPGERCPWDSKDNLREEYKGKDARVFMRH